MLIGLHDADKKYLKEKKNFPNYALMKISTWHKNKGDKVEWFNALKRSYYDLIYSSKIFDYTPEDKYLPKNTIKGGTGYDIKSILSDEIENCYPDYSIYPLCDYAIGFITRGCINKCKFCYVPEKEGGIKPYKKWQEIIRKDSNKLILMDNNILACNYGIEQLNELSYTDYLIDCNQGMDVKLLTDEICEILKRIKWLKYIRFSCDQENQLLYFEKASELFKKHKIPKNKLFIYLLLKKDLMEADNRVQNLKKIINAGVMIYPQAEINARKNIFPTYEQKIFIQDYMFSGLYRTMTWEEYLEKPIKRNCKKHNSIKLF